MRFAIEDYVYAHLCHCDACKKRTGSAYGISVVVENRQVIEFRGETRIFTLVAESGKEVDYEFCPHCAATVRWHVAALKERQILAGGAFDDPRPFDVAGEMYAGMAIPWARIGCEIVRTGEADEACRAALIARRKDVRSRVDRSNPHQ